MFFQSIAANPVFEQEFEHQPVDKNSDQYDDQNSDHHIEWNPTQHPDHSEDGDRRVLDVFDGKSQLGTQLMWPI